MNRRLNKLIKEYEKYETNLIDLTGSNTYLTKEEIKETNYNLNITTNNNIYNNLLTLLNDTIYNLFKTNNYTYITNEIDTYLNEEKILSINYKETQYNINLNNLIDYEQIKQEILQTKPTTIIIGSNYYPRFIDYKKLKEITNLVNAKLIIDITNISGLIITKKIILQPEYFDLIICNLNGMLKGKHGTILLSNKIKLKPNLKINNLVDILNTLTRTETTQYKEQIDKVLINTKQLIQIFKQNNIEIMTQGSDNNLILITNNNFKKSVNNTINLLYKNDILVRENKNGIVIDTSTETFKQNDFCEIGNKISKIIKEE